MILSLQALRGIAVLCVVLMHLKFSIWSFYTSACLPDWLGGAGLACGVDIFFVLSGFVISMTAEKQSADSTEFMLHRVIRVMPLFWIASTPYLYSLIHHLLTSGVHDFTFLWNSIFLIPFFDKHHLTDSALPVGWTLSFEMWFYMLFSLFLILWTAKKVPYFLIILFLLTSPIPFLYQGLWKFPYFAFHPFCWEFALGCLAFLISKPYKLALSQSVVILFFGILGLIYGASNYNWLGWHNEVRSSPELSAIRVLVWGGPSFLIVLGCVFMEKQVCLPPLITPLVFLGNASYSIYLTHIFVYGKMSGYRFITDQMGWKLFAFFDCATALLAGYAIHLFIEKPMTQWLRKRLLPSKEQIIFSAAKIA